jgi:glycosyltransferase involved in cell wall biosynthesis
VIGVMQIVDSLDSGGLERVAVNLANALPEAQYRSFLCTTRRAGPLERLVSPDVIRLDLERRSRFDWRAVRHLAAFVRRERVSILHAHGSSLFVAVAASLFLPEVAVIWHDHYGRYLFDDRPTRLYRLASRRLDGIVSVNRALAAWSTRHLAVDPERIWYVPNFIVRAPAAPPGGQGPLLPGRDGGRVVCVANLREQKDHRTLFEAMAQVVRACPDAHLLLVGGGDASYEASLRRLSAAMALDSHITFLGVRDDVAGILAGCDLGVLSSRSEGFPLALVEYGAAALATISTDVGECAEVLDGGRAGVLVPAADSGALAHALVSLLSDGARRAHLGRQLHTRVEALYTSGQVLARLGEIYRAVLRPAG